VIRSLICLFLISLLSGCAQTPEVWRNIDEESIRVSIFVGQFESAKHIARPDSAECPDPPEVNSDGQEMICISGFRDPPPMKLRIKLHEHIYGDDLGEVVFANTTSHFGLDSIKPGISEKQKYLMIVLSDGITNILPRYHFRPLNQRYFKSISNKEFNKLAIKNSYILPVPYPVSWLPCEVSYKAKNWVYREDKHNLYRFLDGLKTQGFPEIDSDEAYRKLTLKKMAVPYRSVISKQDRYFFEGEILYTRKPAILINDLIDGLKNYTQEQVYEAYLSDLECFNE